MGSLRVLSLPHVKHDGFLACLPGGGGRRSAALLPHCWKPRPSSARGPTQESERAKGQSRATLVSNTLTDVQGSAVLVSDGATAALFDNTIQRSGEVAVETRDLGSRAVVNNNFLEVRCP
jgi:hypothetical protein